MMTNVFNTLEQLHEIINKLKSTQKEYKKLNLILINTIGKKSFFHHAKKLEENINALNVLYVPHNSKGIRHAHISKNQVILLMLADGGKWQALFYRKSFACVI